MTGGLHKGTPASRLYVRWRRVGRRLRRSRRAHIAAAGVAVFAVAFAVGTFVAAPLAVGALLEGWADAGPGRQATVGRIAVNPVTLTVRLDDAVLEVPGVSVEIRRLTLDFDAAALLGRRVALDALEIDAPRMTIRDDAPADAWRAFAPTTPFEIARVTIDGGRVEWHDGAEAPLVVDGVSVRAFGVARPAEMRARVEIDARNAAGGVLRISGELDVDGLAADGRAMFENVDVAPIAARFSRTPSVAGMASGAADFEWRGGERRFALRGMTLRALRMALESADSSDALSAASLEAAGDVELADGEWRLAVELDLLRPTLRLAGHSLEGEAIDGRIEYRANPDDIEGDVRVGARGLAMAQVGADSGSGANIELALALLEDPRGAAEAAYTFSRPNDGRGIGRVLAASLVEELHRIAAMPVDALAAAAGVDAATLRAVSFRPGEAVPVASETLDAWADALAARPKIGVRVQGVADRVVDRNALAAQQIELHVTLEAAGPALISRPQPVDFASPRHQELLEDFAAERLSVEKRETIASYFTRDAQGRVVEAERDAYYRALFDALVENETIPESGIERLGRYRARAVADALTARGIADTRIEIAPAVVRSAADDEEVHGVPEASGTEHVDVPLEVFALVARADAGSAEPPPGAR